MAQSDFLAAEEAPPPSFRRRGRAEEPLEEEPIEKEAAAGVLGLVAETTPVALSAWTSVKPAIVSSALTFWAVVASTSSPASTMIFALDRRAEWRLERRDGDEASA